MARAKSTSSVPASRPESSKAAGDPALNAAARLSDQRSASDRRALARMMATPQRLTVAQLTTAPAPESPTQPLIDTLHPYAQWELACARAFHNDLEPQVLVASRQLHETVRGLFACEQAQIFTLDDTTGLYHAVAGGAMEDRASQASAGASILDATIAQANPEALQTALGIETIYYAYLFVHEWPDEATVPLERIIGLVAISPPGVVSAQPNGGFDAAELTPDMRLDVVAFYLAPKVQALETLKAQRALTQVQKTVLSIASQLVTAVDQEGVIRLIAQFLTTQMPFDVVQFICTDGTSALDDDDALPQVGDVLLQADATGVTSYFHPGLKNKRHRIPQFDGFVGLLQSSLRTKPYLYLPGPQLGSVPLSAVFNTPLPVGHAWVMPLVDPVQGSLMGAIPLVQYHSDPLPEEWLTIVSEVITLATYALCRVKVLEKALAMAATDELTQLPNRRGFYDRFEAELERSRRHGTPLCVAIVDVDHFKKLNDTLGHLNGDRALKHLAHVFRSQLRKSDMISRFGGEEFTFLLPDTPVEKAVEFLERLRAAVASVPFETDTGSCHPVTVSMGVTAVDLVLAAEDGALSNPEIISHALATADERLYQAKHLGRNRVCGG